MKKSSEGVSDGNHLRIRYAQKLPKTSGRQRYDEYHSLDPENDKCYDLTWKAGRCTASISRHFQSDLNNEFQIEMLVRWHYRISSVMNWLL